MIDHTFMIKKIKSLKEIVAIFSQPTRMPFVECDAKTLDDQVHIFAEEKEIQEFAKKYTEKKILLMGTKIPQDQTKGFYNSLHAIGVNAVVFHDNNTAVRIPLEHIEKMPDMNQLIQEKLPVANPSLQLSTLYFLQEMYRPIEHDKTQVRELEEEMLVNLARARFILPLENAKEGMPWKPDDKNQKSRIPYVKDKQEHLLLPVFSDFAEFRKFYKEKAASMGMAVLNFNDLGAHFIPDAFGIVYNPAGFHLNMTVEQYRRLTVPGEKK